MNSQKLNFSEIISKKKLVITYGLPHPLLPKLFVDIAREILSSNLSSYVIYVDPNYNLLPKFILHLEDDFLDRLIIYKPISMTSFLSFLFKLYSTYTYSEKYSILISSFYIHINNKLFKEVGYDPLIAAALLKAILSKPNFIYILVNIDSFIDDFFNLPFSRYISTYADSLFYRYSSKDEFMFKKMSLI